MVSSDQSRSSAAMDSRRVRPDPAHRYCWSRIRPRRTGTPSCTSSSRCVSMLPTLRLRLIPPWALTTRCHGRCAGTCFMACPTARSEEHTSELQSRSDLVCRLLLEKKKKKKKKKLQQKKKKKKKKK